MLEKLTYFDPKNLMIAIIKTHEFYRSAGKDAGSDRWTTDTRKYRSQLIADVIANWSIATEMPDHRFPFHDDAVVHLWMHYRKASDKQAIIEECKIPTITTRIA